MREKFLTRSIRLYGKQQMDVALAMLKNIPLDPANPLELVVREYQKPRSNDQNALYWSNALTPISEQGWLRGNRYTPEIWHEYFKREFLPETNDRELSELVSKPHEYLKWALMPGGDRVLVASTTSLTTKGFSRYLDQVYAFGAELGVMFKVAA